MISGKIPLGAMGVLRARVEFVKLFDAGAHGSVG